MKEDSFQLVKSIQTQSLYNAPLYMLTFLLFLAEGNFTNKLNDPVPLFLAMHVPYTHSICFTFTVFC